MEVFVFCAGEGVCGFANVFEGEGVLDLRQICFYDFGVCGDIVEGGEGFYGFGDAVF